VRSAIVLLLLVTAACATTRAPSRDEDLKAARSLFDANIRAIQEKNREAYLACYRPDPDLVRAGPEGVKLGYEDLATNTATTGSDAWPESLEAKDLEVHWIGPGLVYGAYMANRRLHRLRRPAERQSHETIYQMICT
jgi:hypothetical protein